MSPWSGILPWNRSRGQFTNRFRGAGSKVMLTQPYILTKVELVLANNFFFCNLDYAIVLTLCYIPSLVKQYTGTMEYWMFGSFGTNHVTFCFSILFIIISLCYLTNKTIESCIIWYILQYGWWYNYVLLII